jgi:methanogenic corrinoid protein MtbC1
VTEPPTTDIPTARPRFLRCLQDADEYAATDVALGLVAAGVPAEAVLLDLVAPAQVQVGRWWQRNEWSVAQEHAATHISERVVAAVASYASPRPNRGRVVVACLDGEWHALPARLVAEVLRLRGWHVTFLGASVPTSHLVTYLRQHDAQALALSGAVPVRLPLAHRTVEACRAAGVPVLVGGAAFGPDGRWARRLGAAWAADARDAVAVLGDQDLLRGPGPARLAHLADDEYAALLRRRSALVDSALADQTRRFATVAGFGPAQLDATVDDLGHILDFLAAALYVDDGTLFTDFVGWLVDILSSRGVPPVTLGAALEHYRGQLHDFPRAQGWLGVAGDLVPDGGPASARPAGGGDDPAVSPGR